MTGWSRDHARKALRLTARGDVPKPRAPKHRPLVYGEGVLGPLRKIWATLRGLCGKRLAPFMPFAVEAMERHGELELAPEVRDKLLCMSAATIDRRLAPGSSRLRWGPSCVPEGTGRVPGVPYLIP